MVQFKVDNGQRKRELLEKFLETSRDPILTKCLTNRLEYGSVYPPNIEEKMNKIIDTLKLEHSVPDWLNIVD